MESSLTPLRRIEAKRLLASRSQFDTDHFIELMARVMVGVPSIVEVAAQQLDSWNDDRCVSELDDQAVREEIAEIVLSAAAVYHGETPEEPAPYRATQADFDVWRRVLTTLHGNRDCFQRAANGIISKGAWEAQAAACSRALAELGQLLGNTGMADSDTGV